jgi:hypothetical protein
MSESGKDSESTDKGKEGVGESNDTGVHDSRFVTFAVTAICR